MLTKITLLTCILCLIAPSAFAITKRPPQSAPAGKPPAELVPVPEFTDKPQPAPHVPRPMSEEEYEKRMKSASRLIMAGLVLSAAGGITAIGGSVVAVAKKDNRVIPAAIGAGGLGLSIIGGICTMIGYHHRNTAEQR